MAHFESRHVFNRTSPESSFARTPTAQRRHAAGTDVMRGLVLTRTVGTEATSEVFEDQRSWEDALAGLFGLRPAVPRAAMATLWARLRSAREERAA